MKRKIEKTAILIVMLSFWGIVEYITIERLELSIIRAVIVGGIYLIFIISSIRKFYTYIEYDGKLIEVLDQKFYNALSSLFLLTFVYSLFIMVDCLINNKDGFLVFLILGVFQFVIYIKLRKNNYPLGKILCG